MYNQAAGHFHVAELLMVESGTYNDQVLRPYTANADPQRVMQLVETTFNGRNFSPSNLAGIAGQILLPSAQNCGVVPISNGWGNSRFRFLMRVECGGAFGNDTVYILTGYTDHADASFSGLLDPGMRLFFNNMIAMNVITEMTPMGPVERLRLANASHILSDTFNNNLTALRPEDVFSNLSAAMYGSPTDYRTNFRMGNKLSRRNNGSAPTYLGNTLNAYRQATSGAEPYDDLASTMSNASGLVRESTVTSVTPLFILSNATQWNTTNYITYQELINLSPTVDNVTHIQFAKTMLNPVPVRGSTEYLHGVTPETIAVSTLSQAVPALMMDCVLTSVWFTITNDTIGGYPEFVYGNAAGFSNVDLEPFLQAFQDRFVAEIYNDLTRGNQIVVSLEVNIDVRGDAFFSINFDNNGPVDYAVPTFADAILAPVLTNDTADLANLSNTISHLSDQLTYAYQ